MRIRYETSVACAEMDIWAPREAVEQLADDRAGCGVALAGGSPSGSPPAYEDAFRRLG